MEYIKSIECLSLNTGLIIIYKNIRSMRANFQLFLEELLVIPFLPKVIILSEIWINARETQFYKVPNYVQHTKKKIMGLVE